MNMLALLVLATSIPALPLVPYPAQVVRGTGSVRVSAVAVETDAALAPEGYRLSVKPGGVKIASATSAGAFYARQTLRQLCDADGNAPCVEIEDAPSFGWRGVLLDESRHFFGKETVKRILDRMAAFKLNVFHWHLVDSHGWRLEIDAYPALTRAGATRPIPDWDHWIRDAPGAGTYGPYFYTKEDVREILAYAAARHIRVVPEIEIGGHSREVMICYPGFSCLKPDKFWDLARGDGKDLDQVGAVCLGNDEVIKFYEKVLDEVCELFPDEVVHIGGDECPRGNWKTCPKCQARIKANGLKNEDELQSWATRHFVEYLAKKGRKTLGWDEILQGGLAPGALVMSWRGAEGGIAAAAAGHEVVMCPHRFCYLDYRTCVPGDPCPYPRFAESSALPLEKVYSFDPYDGIPESQRKYILGSQSLNWTESTWCEPDLEYKMWPRTCANAEVLWTGPGQRSFTDFCRRLKPILSRPEWEGVNVAPFDAMPKGRVVTDLSGEGWTCDGEPVSVPHTWNAYDACNGPGQTIEPRRGDSAASRTSYLRKRAVYTRSLPAPTAGRRTFIKFEGASIITDVKVNGQEIGRHIGAFTAFAFDITDALKDEDNLLEVAVDNRLTDLTQPLSADFSVYGGIYRKVWLIETDPVCIDPVKDGANGLRIFPDAKTGEVRVEVTVNGGTNEVQRFKVNNFELWSPENPKVYRHMIELKQNGSYDAVQAKFAFRTIEFRQDGFYLNGQRRQLKGVNRHQDRMGKGWAVSPADEEEDIRLMREMGADALRTAHYPQSQHIYDLCDELGLICWVEYPNVNRLIFTEAFEKEMHRQYREMVAQLRNHPSIAMWGIWNELEPRHGWRLDLKKTIGMMERTRDLVHELDPSRKVVSAADHPEFHEMNGVSDELAYNSYPKWYANFTMRERLDKMLKESGHSILGMSEYGVGGSIRQHDDPKHQVAPGGRWHPEDYQAYRMHDNLKEMTAEPRIWGHFVWAMFDFGADRRTEGDSYGINDKGLVAYDHKTKKDVFHLYQANWRKDLKVLHLVGSRARSLTNATVTVMGVSNVGAARLVVNGQDLGECQPDAASGLFWEDVALKMGDNTVELRCGDLVRTAQWKRVEPAKDLTAPSPRDVPELLTCEDGTKVTNVEEWEQKRRGEILEFFTREVYGRRPVERPDNLMFERAAPDEVMMDGAAIRKRIRANWSGPLGGMSFEFTAFIPKAAADAGKKSPGFVLICNRDPEANIDPDRNRRTEFWPAEEIVQRGYAAIAFWNGDLAPDDRNPIFEEGVYTLYAAERSEDSWGALSAWAWGASRVMDWIENEPLLDAAHIGVVGHSRGGKTALVAGVTDKRFAMACANDSGTSGAKLNHIDLPKSETMASIIHHFPHWFSRRYAAWYNRDQEMPYDQHQWVALMAPRLVAIGSASEDDWAGQLGELKTAELASPAWELYGLKGLCSRDGGCRMEGDRPAVGTVMQDGSISYHLRRGIHNLTLDDWNRYMDFADRHNWR